MWNVLSSDEQESSRAVNSREGEASSTETPALAFVTTAELSHWAMPNTFSLALRYNPEVFVGVDKHNMFVLEPDKSKSCHSRTRTYADHRMGCTPSLNSDAQAGFTSDRTSSVESMQMAAKWLQECVNSHLSCNTSEGGSTWYPTRLLHLADPSEDKNYIRLIRTAREPPTGPYATLSHRWGNNMPFQLTQTMESESNLRFPLTDLPRTFQEAIQVSRQLGILYLWIDSLCIIQSGDDRQDWYREASSMNMVYTNSCCNISATDAEDSTNGLFRHRDPLYIGRPRVKVNLDDFQPDTELVECLMTDLLLWPHILMHSPLDKRGWVFQERYLAPRVLHFCRDQLFWECREHTVCETYPQELPLVSLYYTAAFLKSLEKNRQRIAQRLGGNKIGETDWEDLWTTLVFLYSPKNLSVPGDKLVALSGVAKNVIPHMKDAYIAGMYRKNLERLLIWQVSISTSRPPGYRAPSWSWASVDGRISWDSEINQQSLIHVEDVVLDYATEDITGAVTGGWLDLRGYLKPMRLQGAKHDEGIDWYMIVGSSIVSRHNGSHTLHKIFVKLDTLYGEEIAFDNDNTEERLFFMPAFNKRSPDGRSQVKCLLTRLKNLKSKFFERIGCVDRYLDDDEKDVLLAELDEDTRARLPCMRYENGLHTIRIV